MSICCFHSFCSFSYPATGSKLYSTDLQLVWKFVLWLCSLPCKWETIETLPESRGRGHWQWHACWAPVSVPAMVWSSVCLSAGEGDGDKPGSPSKSDPMDSASGGETLEERSSKEVMVLWWRSAAVKLRGIVELGQVSCSLGVSGQHMECACCYLSRLKI